DLVVLRERLLRHVDGALHPEAETDFIRQVNPHPFLPLGGLRRLAFGIRAGLPQPERLTPKAERLPHAHTHYPRTSAPRAPAPFPPASAAGRDRAPPCSRRRTSSFAPSAPLRGARPARCRSRMRRRCSPNRPSRPARRESAPAAPARP